MVFVEAPFFEELAQVAPFRSRQGGRCGHVAFRLGQHARQEFRFKLLKRLGFGGRVHESIDHQLATIPPFSAVRGGSVDRADLNHRAVGEEKLSVGLTGGSVRKTARFCSCVIYLPDYSTREDHHAGTLDSPGT